VKRADEPGLARPAAPKQSAGRRVVDDAAISREHAAIRHGVNLPERIDTILQRHLSSEVRLIVTVSDAI
jgi:hypothetical protein